MTSKLLSREKIIKEAFDFIDKQGRAEFSLRKLAARLNVQVSSLYNHISGEKDILVEVSVRSVKMFTDCINSARGDLVRDEAAFSTGDAFRSFVNEHPHLYEIANTVKWSDSPEAEELNKRYIEPIFILMKQYGVEDADAQVHILRMIRVVTHGFSSLEVMGAFEDDPGSATESYHLMVHSFTLIIKPMTLQTRI